MAKLLLIDDDGSIRDYFCALARHMGHELVTAADGCEGMSCVCDESVTLILTDLNMPGEPSGMDLVRAIRERRPDCPVVVVSGHPSEERLERCRELGIDEFLAKPFELAQIRAMLARLLP